MAIESSEELRTTLIFINLWMALKPSSKLSQVANILDKNVRKEFCEEKFVADHSCPRLKTSNSPTEFLTFLSMLANENVLVIKIVDRDFRHHVFTL